MQSWHINALELEVAALKELDGFIHEYALYILVGIIYLLQALLTWVLSGALRRKGEKIHGPRPASHFHPPVGTTTATTEI